MIYDPVASFLIIMITEFALHRVFYGVSEVFRMRTRPDVSETAPNNNHLEGLPPRSPGKYGEHQLGCTLVGDKVGDKNITNSTGKLVISWESW